jgi:hypothetical protein
MRTGAVAGAAALLAPSASASAVGKWDAKSVLRAMRQMGPSGGPEQLASTLVEGSSQGEPTACAAETGYEHCVHCALPAIKLLVIELKEVTHEVWQAQHTMETQAETVCTSKLPQARIGGAAKCCSGGLHISAYTPSGLAVCGGPSTFSPPAADASEDKFSYDHDKRGYYYDDPRHASTVAQDCCDTTSTCETNDATLYDEIKAKKTFMDSEKASLIDVNLKIRAAHDHMALQLEHIRLNRAETVTICEMSAAAETQATTTHMWPATLAAAKNGTLKCISGQVPRLLARSEAVTAKVTADIAAVTLVIDVIGKCVTFLERSGDGEDGTMLFAGNTHAAAPEVETYIELLEGTASRVSASEQSVKALRDATKLLESQGRDGANVITLLNQISADMQATKGKMETYRTQQEHDANLQATNLVEQVGNLVLKISDAQTIHTTVQQKLGGWETDKETHTTNLESTLEQYVLKLNERELYSGKCIDFMRWFDAETLTNTEEILILKRAIEIIKHISCEASEAPTLAPTPFPTHTYYPTPYPTPYPTRFPTPNATAHVTQAPTPVRTCAPGNYSYMQKVYQEPDRYSVPHYTEGRQYIIEDEMESGACLVLNTSHVDVHGDAYTISHQYKCCGNSGRIYGAISTGDGIFNQHRLGTNNLAFGHQFNSGAVGTDDICEIEETQCTYFGANMFREGETDLTSAAIMVGATRSPTPVISTYPTRYPTASPTAAPTKYPTAHRTDFPTEAPTAYPTAAAHNTLTASHISVYNISREMTDSSWASTSCTCANGQPATGPACPDGGPICKICDIGFYIDAENEDGSINCVANPTGAA